MLNINKPGKDVVETLLGSCTLQSHLQDFAETLRVGRRWGLAEPVCRPNGQRMVGSHTSYHQSW